MILTIAWRNIWRNKIRSLVVILSIAVGLWAGIFVLAFSWGLYQGHIREVIRYQISHMQIHHPDFLRDRDVKDSIHDPLSIVNMIAQENNLVAVTMRSKGQGMVMSPVNSFGVMISGIDPASEDSITGLSSMIEEGNYLGDAGKKILIGWKLASKLKARLKSKVVIMLQGADGEIVSGAFRVEGIFRTRNTTFDENNIFIHRSDFNQLIGSHGTVHEIAVLLSQESMIPGLQKKLQDNYAKNKIENWRELSPELDMVIGSFNQYMYIFIGIILLALMFGIVNTMLMAVLERQREIGMLMAIGMNKLRLFMMIIMETVLLAMVGGPIGILLSYVTVTWLGKTGIDLSFFSEGLSYYGFSNIVYPALETERYLPVLLMTTLIAILSAIYPAYKALKLKPAAAIRKI